MAHSWETAKEIGFKSINSLLSEYKPSLMASAIEQHGVYTRDGFGRYIKAGEDSEKGWVCRFDDKTLTQKLLYMGDEEIPDRRTQSRAFALLELFNTYWEKADRSGLPLETSNTVTIRIPERQMHILPQETLYTQKTTNTSVIMVPKELRLELCKFGWSSADLPDFETMQQETATLESQNPITTQLQKQHDAISVAINSFGYDPLCIPSRGKAKIKKKCLDDNDLFTTHSFDHAWKAGKKTDPKRWEVKNLEKYKNN